MKRFVLDTNVLVAAVDPKDTHHADCTPLFRSLLAHEIEALCPSLVLVEFACVLGRRTDDKLIAGKAVGGLLRMPALTFTEVNLDVARASAALGLDCALRGADAVIAQLSDVTGFPLVTRDKQLAARVQRRCWVLDPSDPSIVVRPSESQ
ncbi:MAG: type II toxin-antitoxin system VapC family toxin [Deltaproteobacteria bacterium]|nr:type II toxin-antitoxin system VapC family toxin [Deltaproteobacteria bacterium]